MDLILPVLSKMGDIGELASGRNIRVSGSGEPNEGNPRTRKASAEERAMSISGNGIEEKRIIQRRVSHRYQIGGGERRRGVDNGVINDIRRVVGI